MISDVRDVPREVVLCELCAAIVCEVAPGEAQFAALPESAVEVVLHASHRTVSQRLAVICGGCFERAGTSSMREIVEDAFAAAPRPPCYHPGRGA